MLHVRFLSYLIEVSEMVPFLMALRRGSVMKYEAYDASLSYNWNSLHGDLINILSLLRIK